MEHKPITHQIHQLIHNRRLRRRWTRIVACLSAAVLLVTSYMLIHPALTMGGTSLDADTTTAELGESISVTLNANGSGEAICYLAAYGDNAGLTGIRFDNDSAVVSLDNGGSVTLFREVISGGVGYWFAMPSGMQSAQLSLNWINGVGQLLQFEEIVVVEPEAAPEASPEESPEGNPETSPETGLEPGTATNPEASPDTEAETEPEPAIPSDPPSETTDAATGSPAIPEAMPMPSSASPSQGEPATPTPAATPSPSPSPENTVVKSPEVPASTPALERTNVETAVGNEIAEPVSAVRNVSDSDGTQGTSVGSEQGQPVDTKTIIHYTEQQGDSSAPGSLSLCIGSGSTLEAARSAAFGTSPLTLTWTKPKISPSTEPTGEEEETSVTEPESKTDMIPNTENSWATVEKLGFGISPFSAKQAATRQSFGAQTYAETKAAESVDFGQYINSITISQNVEGTWQPVVPGGTVTSGDSIRVYITYSIPENVVGPDCKVIFYQLPAGLGLSEIATGTVTIGNQSAGTYEISTTGMITITFNDEFADDREFSGELEFQGMVTATGEGEQTVIDLGAVGTTITVIPNVTESGLAIEKTGTYDKATNLVHYEITISTEDGSDGPITIEDHFIHAPAYGTIHYETIESLKKIDAAGQEITLDHDQYLSLWDQTTEQTAHFSLTALPELEAGESYTLSYTAMPDLNSIGDGNGYLQFSNVATATDDTSSVEASANITVSKAMIRKEGAYNSQTGKIHWTIYINEDQRDISGMKLEDTLTYTLGETVYTLDLPDTVQVEIFDHNVSLGITKTVSLPYTFPANSTMQYVVTYETDLPEEATAGEAITFHNRAQIGNYWAEVDVNGTIPGDYGVVKSFVDGSGATGIVNWSSWITCPENADLDRMRYIDLIWDITIEDTTLIPNSHYITPALLQSTLLLQTVDGTPLNYGTDYNIFAMSKSSIDSFIAQNNSSIDAFAWAVLNSDVSAIVQNLPWQSIDTYASEEPLGLFAIEFTEAARSKITGSASVLISYSTIVDTGTLPAGTNLIQPINFAKIQDGWITAYGILTLAEKLDKQVSLTGVHGTDTSSYTNDPLTVNIGDHGSTLHYRILVSDYGDAAGITVTDTLPAGAELVEGSVYLRNHPYGTDQFVGETNVWYIQYRTNSNPDGTTTVTFDLSHLNELSGEPLGIYYDVSVANDPQWETQKEITYTNTAFWDGETDSTSTKVKNTRPHLEKTGEQITEDEAGNEVTGNVLRYYITINPEGEDLNPYADTLTLEDTLTIPAGSSAAFQSNTAKLYVYDENNPGGHFCGAPVDVSQYSAAYDSETHIITFTLPDQLACVLVYDYLIDYGTVAGDLDISNTVTLTGQEEYQSESDLVLEEQSSSASVNKATVTIYKHDKDNVVMLLPGAEFLLQRYEDQEDGTYAWMQTSVTAQDPDGHFVVGESGTIILSFLSEASRYNTLYKIEEVAPPEGYRISNETYYFVWMEQGATEESTIANMEAIGALGDVDPAQIQFIAFSTSHYIYVPNEKDELTVTKAWKTETGEILDTPPVDSVTVTLYRWTAENPAKESYGTAELTVENDWSYTWKNLPKQDDAGHDYLYSVEEAPLSGFQVTYENNAGIQIGTIEITNTRNGYVLPETGGNGILHFTIAGWSLLSLYGVGCLFQRRRRRKEACR